ncbi:helix-turn-helix domain-containing protein [Citrobacter freundii]|jgi:CRP-like cAMP-binding protein|uniref:Helix-turn-helix domain-containing protein n=2 Tax=Citrobacter freundii complex TaxID=1344959 RepID=A0A7D6VHR6_CITFR|nr:MULTISPECIES: winged helix-turn-helix transcriptional regulator [Citrobacter]MBA8063696.1 helix-turn-helix domain-containing protein [Citrobacter freundii]MBD0827025.1 helix-turn-helix domain-containing protein [Citrobacter sp. C1]MCS3464598.1 CRP-like cAMP-binding protein [Citrobacter sp. JUb117]NTZ50743.1 Crp/Fnr family transcriptional regulator [Citrobacter gillenii]QCA18439.1 helix-turn-helix domain-containing protein [Citrobacter freundii]
MQILPPVRPEQSIQRLTQALEPIAEKLKVVPRRRILWMHKNQPQLYLFLQGELSILRSSDGLLIVTVYEPHLFGLAEMLQPIHGHLLRAETESTILRVDAHKARELFHKNGLWEDVASIVSYHTGYLFYRDDLVVQQRTYSVIRNHLEEMMLLPEETRQRVAILDYIQERTHLSRSSILNVVSALKKGGYIDFERGGYLTSISRLPERF